MIQIMNNTIPMDPDMYQGDNYTEEGYEEDSKDHLQGNGFLNGTLDVDGNGHHQLDDDNGIDDEGLHDNNGSIVTNGDGIHENGDTNNHHQMIDDGSSDDHDFFNLDSTDGLSQHDTNGYAVEFISPQKPGPRSRKRKMDRPLKVKLTLPDLPLLHEGTPQKDPQSQEQPLSDSKRSSSRPARAHKLPERFTPEVEKRPSAKPKKLSDGGTVPGSTLVLGTELVPNNSSQYNNNLTKNIDDEVPSILARVLADGSPSSSYNNRSHHQVPPLPQLLQQPPPPPPMELIDDSELEVDQYTDQELDREIKRLKVRNLRAEVRRNISQAKFYENADRKFGQLLSVLIKGDIEAKKELVGIKNLLAQSLDIQLDGGLNGSTASVHHGHSTTTTNGHGLGI